MAQGSTNLAVRIATVMDASGLKKADKGISSLEKSAKKLGKVLGAALSVGALTSFGKSSIEAFLSAEKASARLGQVIDNLGMGVEKANIEGLLDGISAKAGIAGEVLIDAYQPLISATRSAADSQSLLALALDVSAGSGQDLVSVSKDLAAAYAGNFKALKKYNLGVSDAELKTMGFAKVAELLNKQFKGSQAKYLETYAGKMQVLGEAAGTAKEIIGKGLVDALMAVTGSIDVQSLSTKLVGFAQNLADAFVKVGNLIAENWAWVKNLGIAIIAVFTATKVYAGVTAFLGLISKIRKAFTALRTIAVGAAIAEMAAINPLAALGAGAALVATIWGANKILDSLMTPPEDTKPFEMPNFEGIADPKYDKATAERLRIAKLNAKIAADEAKRKKAAQIFDMNQIQLIAALKGNVSKEDRARLELQLALATDNTAEVTRLTQQISIAQGYTKELTDYLLNLPDANNPFAAWSGYLDEIELQAKRIAAFGTPTMPENLTLDTSKLPSDISTTDWFSMLTPEDRASLGGYSPYMNYGSGYNQTSNQTPTIVVTIDGKEIATAVQNQNNSGNKTGFSRLGDFLTL